ncbi:MAG: hypothetical protein JG762_321 [Deferribacteraceae bacterium]|jgi:hypothetical protein|nr:hypothetical protein [Deferribacteraceae bacterium]
MLKSALKSPNIKDKIRLIADTSNVIKRPFIKIPNSYPFSVSFIKYSQIR